MTTFFSSIREGIHTVNKNWQLVLLQLVPTVLSCMGFFVIVGLPIAVAFIMFGLDFTEILKFKDAVSALQGSAELLHKYFGMAVLIIMSIVVYWAVMLGIWAFTFAGSAGVMSRSILREIPKFSVRRFLAEGRRMFGAFFLWGIIIFIALPGVSLLIIDLMAGGVSTILDLAASYEPTLAVFFKIFFSLLLFIVFALLFCLWIISFPFAAFYIAHLGFHGSRPLVEAFRETLSYIRARPLAIAFYGIILLLGYLGNWGAIIVMALLLIPFSLLPILGTILYFPFQIFFYLILGYVNLIIIASVLHYYREVSEPEIDGEADISQSRDGGQILPPDETAETPGV